MPTALDVQAAEAIQTAIGLLGAGGDRWTGGTGEQGRAFTPDQTRGGYDYCAMGALIEIEVRLSDHTLEVVMRILEGPDSGLEVVLSPEDATRLALCLEAAASYSAGGCCAPSLQARASASAHPSRSCLPPVARGRRVFPVSDGEIDTAAKFRAIERLARLDWDRDGMPR